MTIVRGVSVGMLGVVCGAVTVRGERRLAAGNRAALLQPQRDGQPVLAGGRLVRHGQRENPRRRPGEDRRGSQACQRQLHPAGLRHRLRRQAGRCQDEPAAVAAPRGSPSPRSCASTASARTRWSCRGRANPAAAPSAAPARPAPLTGASKSASRASWRECSGRAALPIRHGGQQPIRRYTSGATGSAATAPDGRALSPAAC